MKNHYLCSRKQTVGVQWCNGSTTGFGSVCGGSNPPRTTQKPRWNHFPRGFFLFLNHFLVLIFA